MTKSAHPQNADRRKGIGRSIYMTYLFIFMVEISRWRIIAFFDQKILCGLLQIKMDTAIPPRYRRVLKKGRL